MRVVFVIAGSVLVASIAALVVLATRQATAKPPVPAVVPQMPVLKIPDFALIDDQGKPQTQAILDGQLTIVDFFFTNCPLACPVMTSQMQNLQKRLAGSGVRFLSMSIDPANDRPAVLRSYIDDRFKIDRSNWLFLTEPDGQEARLTARNIFAKDLMQFVQENPDNILKTSTGGEMADIAHSVNFFLVGPDRVVIGWYNSQRPEEMDMLFNAARLKAKELREAGKISAP
jgi:cytochrome oxidase Cu insertion factor (SCO1/SenC/PrrC family)